MLFIQLYHGDLYSDLWKSDPYQIIQVQTGINNQAEAKFFKEKEGMGKLNLCFTSAFYIL